MNRSRRYAGRAALFTAVLILLAAVFVTAGKAEAGTASDNTVSLIFTHDMHSHMDADKKMKNGRLVYSGGFARLKSAMDDVKKDYPQSFVLDAGDFSMGTPYQTIFSSQASEMKMMDYLGIEATTFGNHEFDYRAKGLASMLEEASGKGPQLLSANIDWDSTFADSSLKKDAAVLKKACDDYGMKDYTVIEHSGARIAVFGIMGKNAVDYAPESGLIFRDATETAAEVVKKIKSDENVDMIVCLSHCGTIENEKDKLEDTEDYVLAEEVPDIDVIISGHTHTVLDEPVTVGSTYIVSCGSYNRNMGHIVLKRDGERYAVRDYSLVQLDENVKADKDTDRELSKYRKLVDKEYFSRYGYSADQVIARNSIDFTPVENFGTKQGEDTLGDLIADSYKYAIAQAEGCDITGYDEGGVASGRAVSSGEASGKKNDKNKSDKTGTDAEVQEPGQEVSGVDVTVVPSGVVRGSIFKGDVTVADAFNILSLGYGADGSPGYPLVRVYLTGSELKDAAEVDASISDFMGVARLYMSGLEYSWNKNRLILNRAVDVKLNDGRSVEELDDDRLYSVAADLYSCQMLGSVKAKSMGLLKIEPKDIKGRPVTDFEDYIVYDGGKEMKAWYALASYIDSFSGDRIPEYYSTTHERKTEISSISPVQLLKQPNRVALTAAAVLFILVAAIVVTVILIKRRRRKAGR